MAHFEKRGDHSWRFTVEMPRGLDGQCQQYRETVRGNLLNVLSHLMSGLQDQPAVELTWAIDSVRYLNPSRTT